MGDRANVYISDPAGDSGVYLYTHSGGTGLPVVVQKALRRRLRWDDAPYLTRIIFDAMTAGYQGEETGFGISGSMGDSNHNVIVVDPDSQRIWTASDDGEELLPLSEPLSFEAFCGLSDFAGWYR